MSKTGRNEPCPCGSGKKYKRCCLEQEQARSRAATAAVMSSSTSASHWLNSIIGYDDLDQASNRVVELVHENRLDEAEVAAHKLLEDYPEVVDGLERLAMVYEARQDDRRAAETYQKAYDFVRDDEGTDDAIRDYYRMKVDSLSRLASVTAGRSDEDR